MWFLLIGLVCFLLVLGWFLGKNPIGFTIIALIILGAIAFIIIAGYVLLIALGVVN